MKNQPQIFQGESLFNYVPGLFEDINGKFIQYSTKIFFQYICNSKEDDWWKSEIGTILKNYKDSAEQLHELSESIRINVVETCSIQLKELYIPYNEIIFDAIYNCNCFAIAKELMKQYKEKMLTVAAA